MTEEAYIYDLLDRFFRSTLNPDFENTAELRRRAGVFEAAETDGLVEENLAAALCSASGWDGIDPSAAVSSEVSGTVGAIKAGDIADDIANNITTDIADNIVDKTVMADIANIAGVADIAGKGRLIGTGAVGTGNGELYAKQISAVMADTAGVSLSGTDNVIDLAAAAARGAFYPTWVNTGGGFEAAPVNIIMETKGVGGAFIGGNAVTKAEEIFISASAAYEDDSYAFGTGKAGRYFVPTGGKNTEKGAGYSAAEAVLAFGTDFRALPQIPGFTGAEEIFSEGHEFPIKSAALEQAFYGAASEVKRADASELVQNAASESFLEYIRDDTRERSGGIGGFLVSNSLELREVIKKGALITGFGQSGGLIGARGEDAFWNNRFKGEILEIENPERSLIYSRTEYLPLPDNRSDSGAAAFLLPQAVYCSAEGTVFPIDGTEIFPAAPAVYESRAFAEAYETADLTGELSQKESAEIRSASAGGDDFSDSSSAFEKTDGYLSDRYETAIGGTDIDMDIIIASITEAVAEAAGVIKERA